jgi:hypothetical protein
MGWATFWAKFSQTHLVTLSALGTSARVLPFEGFHRKFSQEGFHRKFSQEGRNAIVMQLNKRRVEIHVVT